MKEINLKNQLTEQLKNTWYYQAIKWGLIINKNSVVFDHEFKFKVKKHTDIDGVIWYTIDFYISDKYYQTITGAYQFDEPLLDNPNDILDNICLFIANCI